MFASPATRGLLAASALVWALAGAPDAAAWSWPADGPVLRAFSLGDNPYAGGQHRGVDVAVEDAQGARAPAPGEVTFAGTLPGHAHTVGFGEVVLASLLYVGVALAFGVTFGFARVDNPFVFVVIVILDLMHRRLAVIVERPLPSAQPTSAEDANPTLASHSVNVRDPP